MADNNSDPKKDIFFQTAIITFIHPETGDKVQRSFIGKAFFTPEQIEEFNRQGKEVRFHSLDFDKPYNPFEDDDNTEIHRKMTEHVREALNEDKG